jgi:hypothetical protein
MKKERRENQKLCQKDVKKLSKSCQKIKLYLPNKMEKRNRSKSCQKVVKKLSKV